METDGINLLEAVKQEAAAVGSLFRDTLPGRDALWDFMDVNNWFGLEHIGAGRDARVPSLEPMQKSLNLWLRAYGKSRSEKIDLMLEAYAPVFPQTCSLFQQFIQKTDCKERDSTWKLLDFILASLDRETLRILCRKYAEAHYSQRKMTDSYLQVYISTLYKFS